MKNLPVKDKIFWSNFFQFIAIFIIAWLIVGYGFNNPEDNGPRNGGFLVSYILLSSFCVLYLGVKVGLKFAEYEDITQKMEDFLKREKISIQEFRKKYRDVIYIYDNSIDFFDNIKKEEKKCETCEFVNYAGNKEIITLGYKDTEKCDIYWDDIIASKYNKKEIVNDGGTDLNVMDSDFDPEEALDFINKTCPFCNGSVDRFFFIANKKRDIEWNRWMEFCFKCKKLIFLETDLRD